MVTDDDKVLDAEVVEAEEMDDADLAVSTSNVVETDDDIDDEDMDDSDALAVETAVPAAGSDQASMLLSLEELIKNHVESIDKMRLELKKNKEMYDDTFNNNPTYREHNEKVKEATKARSAVKQQITKQPSVALLDQKVKDLRFDIAEKNKTLSDLLQDYKEQTGATSIETRDGQVLEIVSTSRLVRRSAK